MRRPYVHYVAMKLAGGAVNVIVVDMQGRAIVLMVRRHTICGQVRDTWNFGVFGLDYFGELP